MHALEILRHTAADPGQSVPDALMAMLVPAPPQPNAVTREFLSEVRPIRDEALTLVRAHATAAKGTGKPSLLDVGPVLRQLRSRLSARSVEGQPTTGRPVAQAPPGPAGAGRGARRGPASAGRSRTSGRSSTPPKTSPPRSRSSTGSSRRAVTGAGCRGRTPRSRTTWPGKRSAPRPWRPTAASARRSPRGPGPATCGTFSTIPSRNCARCATTPP